MIILPFQSADVRELDTPEGIERLQAVCSHNVDTLGQALDRSRALAGVRHCEVRVSPRGTGDSYTLRIGTHPAS
jgi:hypothetical protein